MIPLIILAIESPEDRDYMAALYLENQGLMYWEIYKYVKNDFDAQDVLQSVLVRLIDKIPDLKEKGKNKRNAYILATCRNTSINFVKKNNRIMDFEFEFQESDGVDFDSNVPEAFALQNDEYAILYAAWKTLDEKSRYLLDARYVLEKSIKEIAKDLEIQPNCARTHLSRARNKLRQRYHAMEETPCAMR